MNGLKALQDVLGRERIEPNKNISPYLSFRTKALAEFFFEAKTKTDIIDAVSICKKIAFPFFLLGGGSNVAVTKDVINGLVIKNSYQEKTVVAENNESVELLIGSGYPMGKLVKETVAKGWEGFEYHLGLPGSIGGGIYMNSKWTKPLSCIGDNLLCATLLDNQKIKIADRNYFNFSYDYSVLQDSHEIVLDATFILKRNSPEILKRRADESLAYRKSTQPFGVATGGCFFQNIDGKSAGQLIDLAGLKNTKVGSFIVSDKHANFIINTGEGKPSDLLELVNLIKTSVKEKFDVNLKEEVIIL